MKENEEKEEYQSIYHGIKTRNETSMWASSFSYNKHVYTFGKMSEEVAAEVHDNFEIIFRGLDARTNFDYTAKEVE